MNTLTLNNMKTLVFSGDIHGEFETIVYKLNHYTETVLIVCGDIGMGFHHENYYLTMFKKLNLKLSKTGNQLVMFRGNHDDPEYFKGTFTKYKHIHLIPDYTVVEVAGIANVLCIGGATSIDRTYRIREQLRCKSKLYWGDAELPVYEQDKLDEINTMYTNNIQIVATHSCPSFAYPTTKQGIANWLLKDPTLDETLNTERHTMDQIFDNLHQHHSTITDWYYAHYHEHKLQPHYTINFRLCDCAEINEYKSAR